MSGPQMVPGSVGSPAGRLPSAAAVMSTASSNCARGTTRRVVMAHPCPACTHTVKAATPQALRSSASSSTTNADFPPSSRKTRLSVPAAWAITVRPVAVEPVKLTWSTRSSSTSRAPKAGSDDGRMLTTPAGMSVSSAMSRPSTVAHHGVSGAGFKMTVLPAASAGPNLARLI